MECSVVGDRVCEEGREGGEGRGGVSYKVSSCIFYNPIYTMSLIQESRLTQ